MPRRRQRVERARRRRAASGVERRLRAAGDDRVGVAGLDHPRRRRRSRARRAAQAETIAVATGRAARSAWTRAPARGVAHHQRDGERRDLLRRPPRSRISLPRSSVPMPPMPVPMMQPMRSASYGSSSSQPASAQRLVAGDERELGEAVGAADLLDREVLGRARTRVAAPSPSSMPDDAGAPALMQRAGADPERGDGADAGDDDLAASCPRGSPPGRSRRRRS